MSSIDPAIDSDTVAKLSAYPWFHGQSVPKYDSGQYSNRTAWKQQHKSTLVSNWTRTVPTQLKAIQKAAFAAVDFQIKLGCEGIVLAGPLTTMADQSLQSEVAWIEAGLDACEQLKVSVPVYATIALSEEVLQVPALKNPLVHGLSNQVSARGALAGAYIAFEQFDAGSYVWNSKDALLSLLIMVDDLYRGAGKHAIVNYLGSFGAVAKAAGAEVWSTGYYLTQRRFSRKAKIGRARPRYYSLPLAGDIGLEEDLGKIRDAGIMNDYLTPTAADDVLRTALKKGKSPADVPEWEYSMNNTAAAQQHYMEVASQTGSALEGMPLKERRKWVHDWLKRAVQLANTLKAKHLIGMATDVNHQQVWLDVFEEWQSYAKQ